MPEPTQRRLWQLEAGFVIHKIVLMVVVTVGAGRREIPLLQCADHLQSDFGNGGDGRVKTDCLAGRCRI